MKIYKVLVVLGGVTLISSLLTGFYFFQDTKCACPGPPVPEIVFSWDSFKSKTPETTSYCPPNAGCALATFDFFIDVNAVGVVIFLSGLFLRRKERKQIPNLAQKTRVRVLHPRVLVFLLLSVFFAAVHKFAMMASLYWYYWWFDMVMHFWGGILITLGIYSLSTFSGLRFVPKLSIVLSVLAVVTGIWEVFEFSAGLYDPGTYLIDTIQDILLGFGGGLLAYALLRRYKIS